jgi:hypothetical protein
MNKISIFKKPAIIKLWLGRAVPVYVFLVLSFIIIKFGLTAYLKHKYPPLIKEDTIFGVRVPFAKRVYKDRWLVTYDKWSPYFYVTVIGIAGIWMFVLLGSTSEVARDLSMSALEKSDKEEAADDLSRAIYNLKIAASFSLDENLIDDINKKIEQLKSSLSSKSAVLNKTFTGQKHADSGKTVLKQTSDNAD